MKWHVLDAVFKRNFVAYFSNPTGYVFICVFVLLGSLAAFWPPALQKHPKHTLCEPESP